MAGRVGPLEHSLRNLANLPAFRFGRLKARRNGGQPAGGDHHAAAAGVLLQLSERVQRNPLDVGQNHRLVLVGPQRQRSLFDPSDLAQHLVVEEVEVEPRFEHGRNDIRPQPIAQLIDRLHVPRGEAGPGVVVGQIQGNVVGRLALTQQAAQTAANRRSRPA